MGERRAAALRICAVLRANGHRALLAGGCVRDQLLGVEPKDYDVATNAQPSQVAALFPRSVGVGAAFGVQIVVMPECLIEVAAFRRDGPYTDGRHPDYVEFVDEIEDARRRDFTVNALFYDPEADRVLDYVGGRDDMKSGILRAVGDPRKRFEEDHLRLLRAVRFAARLGYAVDPLTLSSVKEMAGLIVKTSAERIRDEILKMLTEGHAGRAFELLDSTGLLAYVLPEVAAMKGVAQPEAFHPEGDVWQHTLAMLDLLHTDSPTLALASLLHDVGKPVTQTFEDRIRFNNHDKVGARIAESMGRRLRLSGDEIARVGWIVENHMRVAAVPDMRESRRKRFVRHAAFPELLEVCRLDCLASHGDMSTIEWIEGYIRDLPPEQLKPTPLLTGNDLIAMGYAPGPLFSEILTVVEDAQLEGEIDSADQARALVRERWPSAS